MRQGERGFTSVELLVATAIIALIAGGATMTIAQAFEGTERNNNHVTAVNQVQNAGYWISHDAQMAAIVDTDNLTPPDFLILKWTDWGYDEDSIYNSVTYSIEAVSEGIGKLKRRHQDTAGTDEQILVAEYVYYNPADPDNTTKATHDRPVLTVKLVSIFGGAEETREYKIFCRRIF